MWGLWVYVFGVYGLWCEGPQYLLYSANQVSKKGGTSNRKLGLCMGYMVSYFLVSGVQYC